MYTVRKVAAGKPTNGIVLRRQSTDELFEVQAGSPKLALLYATTQLKCRNDSLVIVSYPGQHTRRYVCLLLVVVALVTIVIYRMWG